MTALQQKSNLNVSRCLTGLRAMLTKAVRESMAESDRVIVFKFNAQDRSLEIVESSSKESALSLDDSTMSDSNHHRTPLESAVERNTDRLTGTLKQALPKLLGQRDPYSAALIKIVLHKGKVALIEQTVLSSYDTQKDHDCPGA